MFEINSPFTMVVMIVLIAVGSGLVKTWIETRSNGKVDDETRLRLQDLEREVIGLRDRVKVLETITTDKDSHLRDEITRLA